MNKQVNIGCDFQPIRAAYVEVHDRKCFIFCLLKVSILSFLKLFCFPLRMSLVGWDDLFV